MFQTYTKVPKHEISVQLYLKSLGILWREKEEVGGRGKSGSTKWRCTCVPSPSTLMDPLHNLKIKLSQEIKL
jgi:hypothetical protein